MSWRQRGLNKPHDRNSTSADKLVRRMGGRPEIPNPRFFVKADGGGISNRRGEIPGFLPERGFLDRIIRLRSLANTILAKTADSSISSLSITTTNLSQRVFKFEARCNHGTNAHDINFKEDY